MDAWPLPADGVSIGLTSMQERARLVGGEIQIKSTRGRGTVVIALLPLPSISSEDTPRGKVSRQ